MQGNLRSLLWRYFFWAKRHAVSLVCALFLAIGTLSICLTFIAPAYRDILMNLGTEFIGGVLLLIGFAAVQSQARQQQGIDYAALEYNLERTRKRIRILSTFSYMFCNQDSIGTEVDPVQVMRCRRVLNHVARQRTQVEVEILILDPTSGAAQARANDRMNIDVIKCIWENVAQLRDWLIKYAPDEGNRQVLKVRVYDAIPRLSIIQWDDTVSISFFERNKPVSLSRRTEFSIELPLGLFLSNVFDELWDDPKTEELEEFLKKKPIPTKYISPSKST